jgi:hypothetical protein
VNLFPQSSSFNDLVAFPNQLTVGSINESNIVADITNYNGTDLIE